jgi:Cof subfamily protein (haloacid dehalogenase superfamily)
MGMGKFTGIIIVSDIDGTFLSKVPENYKKNISAIEEFKAEGGIFTFATGRDFHSLKKVVPETENLANAPIIISNGAKLYDITTNQYIIDAGLNIPVFMKFIKSAIEKYPEIGVRFSGDGVFMTPDINSMIIDDLSKDNLLDRAKEMPLDEIDRTSKCVIVHTNPEILDDVQKMGEEFDKGKNFYFAKSFETGLEAVNKDYTKGKTAQKLKEYLNIPNSVLYAIGDYYNDVDMILAADIGVCPENAVDTVKALVKIITKSCDEGAVADLIKIINKNKQNNTLM